MRKLVSTLSWGILYDSLLNMAEKQRAQTGNGFNPLLRNSLWFFEPQDGDKPLYETKFQPSLEEFFMIQLVRRTSLPVLGP